VPLHRGRDQLANSVEQLFDTRRFTHCVDRRIRTVRGGAAPLQQRTLITQHSPANQRHTAPPPGADTHRESAQGRTRRLPSFQIFTKLSNH
jgi:hypothetical protein